MRAKKDPFGQKKPTRVTHPLYLFAITAYSYKSSEWKESGIGIDVGFSGRFYVRKNCWDIRGGIDVATITAVKTSDHYRIEVRFNDNKKASCSGTNLWMIWKIECCDLCPNKARNDRIEVTTCWGNWRIRFSGTLTYRKILFNYNFKFKPAVLGSDSSTASNPPIPQHSWILGGRVFYINIF